MLFVGRKKRTSIHRRYQNKFLKEMCADLHPKRVLNLGATPAAHDKEGKLYAEYFPGAEFKALDTSDHDHPDYIKCDLVEGAGNLGKFDLILGMSIFEHVTKPWIAAENVTDLLASGGYLYVAMPWFYPVHEGEDFGDYWRATPAGLVILFEKLELVRQEWYPKRIELLLAAISMWYNWL